LNHIFSVYQAKAMESLEKAATQATHQASTPGLVTETSSHDASRVEQDSPKKSASSIILNDDEENMLAAEDKSAKENRQREIVVVEETTTDLVDWDGPDDPENPQNWSPLHKWSTIALVSTITFVTYDIFSSFWVTVF
jgi:hypothetical protein